MKRFYAGIFCIVSFWTFFGTTLAETCDCEGEPGQRWTNTRDGIQRTGGCVAYSATVSEDTFIAPSANVCGSAVVSEQARIFNGCLVTERSTFEGAACYGNAVISGDSVVSGKYVRVYQQARVSGGAELSGTVTVKGDIDVDSGSYSSGSLIGEMRSKNITSSLIAKN